MIKQENRGGRRENSGRRPIRDKKLQVNIMLRMSEIEALGGLFETQKFLMETVKNKLK
jgi:hypothetical protein